MNRNEFAYESLKGIVQKVIFSNKETGFSVAALKSGKNGEAREVILSGNLPNISVGEEISAEGMWVDHPKYGKQFKTSSYMKVLPTKAESIEAYLASGMIKGMGPSTAQKIVAAFGAETLEILSKAPTGSWRSRDRREEMHEDRDCLEGADGGHRHHRLLLGVRHNPRLCLENIPAIRAGVRQGDPGKPVPALV